MICEVCGCTDERACFDPETELPCYWAEAGLCSVCARTRGPLKRIVAMWGRRIRVFFPPARQHVLAAIHNQVVDDGMDLRDEGWYCGDPTCPFCLEEGRVPPGEAKIRKE